MQWFGKKYEGGLWHDCAKAETPVGAICGQCGEEIAEGDDGVLLPLFGAPIAQAFHYACHMRALIGGLNHLRGTCTCCGGEDPPDPPEMTRRQAAEAAVAEWEARN
jgi:hypothetical protein